MRKGFLVLVVLAVLGLGASAAQAQCCGYTSFYAPAYSIGYGCGSCGTDYCAPACTTAFYAPACNTCAYPAYSVGYGYGYGCGYGCGYGYGYGCGHRGCRGWRAGYGGGWW